MSITEIKLSNMLRQVFPVIVATNAEIFAGRALEQVSQFYGLIAVDRVIVVAQIDSLDRSKVAQGAKKSLDTSMSESMLVQARLVSTSVVTVGTRIRLFTGVLTLMNDQVALVRGRVRAMTALEGSETLVHDLHVAHQGVLGLENLVAKRT